MKKEIFAVLLLTAMIVAALFNVHYLEKITEEMVGTVETAAQYADADEWEKVAAAASDAVAQWEKYATYTHIVLRHSEINATTSVLYELLKEAYAQNAGEFRGAVQAVISQLSDIAKMEKVSIGTIF